MRLPRWVRPLSLALATVIAVPATTMVAQAVETPLAGPARITAAGLTARVSDTFPSVLEYIYRGVRLGGAATTETPTVLIDGRTHTVSEVSAHQQDASQVTYTVHFDGTDIVMKASLTAEVVTSQQAGSKGVARPAVTFAITEMTGAHTVEIPSLNLISISSASSDNSYAMATTAVSRTSNPDVFGTLTDADARRVGRNASAYTFLTQDGIAVGLETNATAYQPNQSTLGARPDFNGRWTNAITSVDGHAVLSSQPGQWVYRGEAATDAIGDDPRPYVTVVFTGDANGDEKVDWQDGALAYADIAEPIAGAPANHNWVITHIPFNFASQATHPFQRTADDVKRVSLATDGLGQRVMLKGYGAEGHDSAHVDYANNINNRAGGESGLKAMLKATQDVNAIYGVHVNATEAYPESQDFGSLPFSGGRGWNWLGQSYYVDLHQDLGRGSVVRRFQDFRDEFPLSEYPNFRWVYLDVYYGSGWTADRLGHELNAMGWEVGSEWSQKFERYSLWSHWSNDENYGGYANKGMNSDIIRFIDNANKDTWNPNVVLGYPQIVDFEGWTGHQDQVAFYRNLWGNNLPAKFLQDSRIMSSTKEAADNGTRLTYTFANGTVGTGVSTVTAQTEGSQIKATTDRDMAASRSITYDGAQVLRGSTYLLPWTDNGTEAGAPRLYYYNPAGTETTWTLTQAYRDQSSLTLYRLTDAGKVKVADLAVSDGAVTIPASAYDGIPVAQRSATAFVLYPATTPDAVSEPHWGEGTFLTNPGFDGGVEGYTTDGSVSATVDRHRDPVVAFGPEESTLSQTVTGLPAGTYQASAWIDIAGGRDTREVELKVTGENVRPAGSQQLPASAAASPEHPATIVFENFESVPQGWGIFVKGNAGGSTDPRTVLSPLNAPWTQKGSTHPDGRMKPTDDVIGGHWSLRSHEENGGLIYRTVPQTVNFMPGHRYRVSFDYENAYEGSYSWITGYTRTTATGPENFILDRTSMPQQTTATRFESEFTAGGCGAYFVGLERGAAHGAFDDFTIDNVRVEDLGISNEAPGCLLPELSFVGAPQAGQTVALSGRLTNNGDTEVSDLAATVVLPEGWTTQVSPSPTTTLAPGQSVRLKWVATAPRSSAGQTVSARLMVTYRADGEERSATAIARTAVLRSVDPDGVTYLSDLPFSTDLPQRNGWGPIERDMSNGEQESGDGDTLTLRGTEFAKGLGTHAASSVGFNLGGQCHTLAATVGVQDGRRGSVAFRVSTVRGGARTVVKETGVLTQNSAAEDIRVDVTGADAVLLEVTDGGNGNGSDHADWADARVACGNGTVDATEETPAVAPYTGPLTLVNAPTAYTANPADKMFDGNPATFYDKNWWPSTVPHPSDIDLSLLPSAEATSGEAQIVQGLAITGRHGQANGRISAYEVYSGQDAGNITTLVTRGTLPNREGQHSIVFDQPVETKFLKLRVLSSYRTKTTEPEGLLSIAELGLLVPAPAEEEVDEGDGEASEDGDGETASSESDAGSAEPEESQESGPVTVRLNAGAALGNDDGVETHATTSDVVGSVSTLVSRSVVENYVAADQKHGSFFQRVPVTFTVPSDGASVTVSLKAVAGQARVMVDDLRLVGMTPSSRALVGVDCTQSPLPQECTSRFANAALAQRLVTVPDGDISIEGPTLTPGAFAPLDAGERNSSGVGLRERQTEEVSVAGQLDKTGVRAGDVITIEGSSWRTGERVTVMVDGQEVLLPAVVPAAEDAADDEATSEEAEDGESAEDTTPAEAEEPGDETEPGVSTPGADGASHVQPPMAPVRARASVFLGRFMAASAESPDPDGAATATTSVMSAIGDDDGAVSFTWTVPSDLARGAHLVTLQGGAAERVVNLPFVVLDPQATVRESEVKAGETVTVDGSGWQPGDTVRVMADGVAVAGPETVDERGQVTVTWTVPRDHAGGTVFLTLQGAEATSSAHTVTITASEPVVEPGESAVEPGESAVEPGEPAVEPGDGPTHAAVDSSDEPAPTDSAAPGELRSSRPVKKGGVTLAKTGVGGLFLLALAGTIAASGVVLTRRSKS